jgi:archaellum component FlaC
MEFKLFGRMKDDDESGSSTATNQQQQSGRSARSDSSSALSGGSLERTVKNMSQQGYSDEDIMQELQGQYSKQEIQRAMNNAVTDSATGGRDEGGPQPLTQYSSDQEQEAVSPMDQGYNQGNDNQRQQQNQQQQAGFQSNQGFQQQGQAGQQPQQQQQQTQQAQPQNNQQQVNEGGEVDPAVEELIETIVAENFQRVKTEFENVYEELDAIEEELEDLDQRVHDLEVRDDEDQQQFIEKMDEIEQHIDDYESRIGGLEKAFQQVLPSLVDNVRDLTSLVQEIKQERGIETETNVSQDEMDDMDMDNW